MIQFPDVAGPISDAVRGGPELTQMADTSIGTRAIR